MMKIQNSVRNAIYYSKIYRTTIYTNELHIYKYKKNLLAIIPLRGKTIVFSNYITCVTEEFITAFKINSVV